jgi:hypothetical protein
MGRLKVGDFNLNWCLQAFHAFFKLLCRPLSQHAVSELERTSRRGAFRDCKLHVGETESHISHLEKGSVSHRMQSAHRCQALV